VAVEFGCPRVLRVNDASELPDDLTGTVGVTAGASAPEALVQAVVDRLDPVHGVERAPVTVEEEYFPPPPELRELLRGLETALCLFSAAPVTVGPPSVEPGPGGGTEPTSQVLTGDRTTVAADVLEQLAG
jgi:4-hydroxy-3-methylbut-2-enyl diphosphate reductase